MDIQKDTTLSLVKELSAESHAGLLLSYKALKRFGYDYQQALVYLKSDEFKNIYRM